jgi:hypothetical protein
MECEREDDLKRQGWKPEINLIVYAKEDEEEREIHYHGLETILDMTALIQYLTGRIAAIEEARRNHE